MGKDSSNNRSSHRFSKSVVIWGLIVTSATLAMAQDPVWHWPLDENSGSIANDASGNGSDASFQAEPGWRAGIVDGAVLLDGSTDFAVITDNGPGHPLDISGAMTVAAWVNPNSLIFAQREHGDLQRQRI
jgi:hypothetical protein